MTRLSLRPHREQQPLLAACTTSRPAPAAHLGRRRDRDRPIGFADVVAQPEPAWARSGHNISRYSVAGLVPAGQLALVPLATPTPDPAADPQPIEALIERARYEMECRDIAFVDDLAEDRRLSDARCTLIAAAAWVDDAAGLALAEDVQDVLDAFTAHPELAHDTALLMALAPVVAMLKGSVA